MTYSLAINEAIHQMMEVDPRVMLIGQGVKSPWYVGNTTRGLLEKFGELRVLDTPVSENAVTGAAVGAAVVGMRPIVVHPRVDFMMYALDPLLNQAANWHYMFGGKSSVPLVVWAIVNRGGEQGAPTFASAPFCFCPCARVKSGDAFNPVRCEGVDDFRHPRQQPCDVHR
jgi:pyruvate/2-oxoglutarate/acetoin dehydrogenase E1 component